MIDKIKYIYHNPSVKNKLLNKDIIDYMKKIYKGAIKNIDIVISQKSPFDLLEKYLYVIGNDIMYIYVLLVDLYFLRRFLDKDYITNGICYSGALHSSEYIHILIKYFNFKITHISHSDKSANQLTQEIKKFKVIGETHKLINPDNPVQCSNISKFPKNFE